MRIDSPNARTHILLKDDGTEVGRLQRLSWFGHKAELFSSGHIYLLEPARFSQKIKLTFQGTSLLEVTFNWRGVIHLNDLTDPARSLTVRQESIWKSNYLLQDAQGRTLASWRVGLDWSKFRHVFILNVPDDLQVPTHVLLTALYAVNVYRSRKRAAAAS